MQPDSLELSEVREELATEVELDLLELKEMLDLLEISVLLEPKVQPDRSARTASRELLERLGSPVSPVQPATADNRVQPAIRASLAPSGQVVVQVSRARLGHRATRATPDKPDPPELLALLVRLVLRVSLETRDIPVSKDLRVRRDNPVRQGHRETPGRRVTRAVPGRLDSKVSSVSRVSLVSLELLELQVRLVEPEGRVQLVKLDRPDHRDSRVRRVRPDRRVKLGRRVQPETSVLLE